VIKLDIINKVADKTGVPKIKAEVAVEALFDAMKRALQNGERIELRGFGVFVVKPRKRGVGRNPRTGQRLPSRPVRRSASNRVRSFSPDRVSLAAARPSERPTANRKSPGENSFTPTTNFALVFCKGRSSVRAAFCVYAGFRSPPAGLKLGRRRCAP
jgi:DNA-binding protein HU-beta